MACSTQQRNQSICLQGVTCALLALWACGLASPRRHRSRSACCAAAYKKPPMSALLVPGILPSGMHA